MTKKNPHQSQINALGKKLSKLDERATNIQTERLRVKTAILALGGSLAPDIGDTTTMPTTGVTMTNSADGRAPDVI
jgi:hypothetical protein